VNISGLHGAALAVIALAGAWVLLPGAGLAADPTAADIRERNRLLEQRLQTMQSVIDGDPCNDPRAAALVKPLPASAASTAPPAVSQAATPARPAPEQSAALPPTVPPLGRTALVDQVRRATVMVLAKNETGSGFFVAPGLVLTNYHVVQSATDGEVVVLGAGLAGARRGQVLSVQQPARSSDADYAIIRVDGPATVAPMALNTGVRELEPVVAAGYPGLLLGNDKAFQAMLRGDISTLPELAFSQGAVMAIQNRAQGSASIAHSAPISSGNSGGPLIDPCGRVIGINTFITIAQKEGQNAGFALAADDMLRFLAGAGVAAVRDDRDCGG
jgi:S1-C subfamily serine protease